MGLAHLATHVGKAKDAILKIYEPDLVRARSGRANAQRAETGWTKHLRTSGRWAAVATFPWGIANLPA